MNLCIFYQLLNLNFSHSSIKFAFSFQYCMCVQLADWYLWDSFSHLIFPRFLMLSWSLSQSVYLRTFVWESTKVWSLLKNSNTSSPIYNTKNYTHTHTQNLHNTDNHDDEINQLEPDILECKVKWALGSITTSKGSGDDGIPVELFQILKDDAVKVLHSIHQQIRKIQQWPQD